MLPRNCELKNMPTSPVGAKFEVIFCKGSKVTKRIFFSAEELSEQEEVAEDQDCGDTLPAAGTACQISPRRSAKALKYWKCFPYYLFFFLFAVKIIEEGRKRYRYRKRKQQICLHLTYSSLLSSLLC